MICNLGLSDVGRGISLMEHNVRHHATIFAPMIERPVIVLLSLICVKLFNVRKYIYIYIKDALQVF